MWPFKNRNRKMIHGAMPYLKATAVLAPDEKSLQLSHSDSPVMTTWMEDLNICYLYDEGDWFSYLNHQIIEHEGISATQLHDLALRNISKWTFEVLECGSFFAVRAGGNFESSAVFSGRFMAMIDERFNGQVVAAMPTRDVFAFCPAMSNDGIGGLRRVIERLKGTKDHSLTTRLLEYGQGKWGYHDA